MNRFLPESTKNLQETTFPISIERDDTFDTDTSDAETEDSYIEYIGNEEYIESFNNYAITAETPPDPFICIESRSRLKWVEDSSVERCQSCNGTFGMFFRRHHCLLEGTPVTMANGMARRIEDISLNTRLPAWDKNNTNIVVSKGTVNDNMDQGFQPCYKVILEDGRELVATSDHKILAVPNDDSQAEPTYIKMKDLTVDHRLVCSVLEGVLDDSSLDKDSKFILAGPSFNMQGDRDKALAFARLCGYNLGFDTTHFPAFDNILWNDVTILDSSVIGNKLNDWLINLTIPSFIKHEKCPKSIQREFIAAWFGRDTAINNVKISKTVRLSKNNINNIIVLNSLLNNVFDINSKISINNADEIELFIGSQDIIKFTKDIGFRYSIENSTNLTILSTYQKINNRFSLSFRDFLNNIGFDFESDKRYFTLRIITEPTSYKDGKPQHVYDLSVPKYTSFVANGIGLSNCRSCGNVFCYTCSDNWSRIPEYISQIPSHNGVLTDIDRTKKYRLCNSCNDKIEHIKRLEVMLKVFQLVELDIVDFKNIAKVCKLWRQLANFYLSKFREIQYKLPYQDYTDWERNALWINRQYLKGHDIWSIHLLRANKDDPKRVPAIVEICENLNMYNTKSRLACWNRMCTRSCLPRLSEETAILLLDALESNNMEDVEDVEYLTIHTYSDSTIQRISLLIVNAFERCDDEILESYLPYLMDKIFRITNDSDDLINFIMSRCRENIRIANCVYWEIKILSEIFGDKGIDILKKLIVCLPESFKDDILISKEFVDIVKQKYRSSRPHILAAALDEFRETVSPVYPELGKQNIRSGGISVKLSATNPVSIPLEKEIKVKGIKRTKDGNYSQDETYSRSVDSYSSHNSYSNHNSYNSRSYNDMNSNNIEYSKIYKSSLLYKREDVRKDLVIMSIIKLMKRILHRKLGIDMNIVTYNIQPTSSENGFIGIVDDCTTLYHITEEKKISILNYIINENPKEQVHILRQRFIKSCAAYTVITFLLSVNDRHLDNILLTSKGELFHIDYGFILGQDPKPVKTPSMRITSGMLEALGGYHSESYEEFKELCETIYDVLRKHVNTFVCLLSLLPKHTGNKTWTSPHITEERIIKEIVKRFAPGENYQEAKALLRTRIDNSTNTSSLSKYHVIDFFHRHRKEGTISNVFSYTINSTVSGAGHMLGGIWNYLSGSNN